MTLFLLVEGANVLCHGHASFMKSIRGGQKPQVMGLKLHFGVAVLLPEGCSLLERLVRTQFGLESDFAQGFRLLAWFLFSKLATLFSNLCSGAVRCSLPISFMSTVPYSYHRADFQKAAETFILRSKASEEKPLSLLPLTFKGTVRSLHIEAYEKRAA